MGKFNVSERTSDRVEVQNLPFSNKFMIACLLYFLALKLIISFTMQPLGDEAYYWLWGKNPAWSYFDHPGLAGWVLGLSSAIFGDNLIGLRAVSLATTVGSAFVLFLYARRLAPVHTKANWLFVLLVVAASPTLFVWSTIVYHDHLLIFLTLGSLYCFTAYFSDIAKNQSGQVSTLYLGALVLGLAGLTKYSAVFVGLAVALLVLFHPKLRPLLRSVHIYAAGLISVIMQAPTIYWNLNRDFASFGFHLNDRHGADWLTAFNTDAFFNFLLATIILFGPFLIGPFIKLFRIKTEANFAGIGVWFARLVTIMSTGTFMFIAFFSFTLWYWSDLSYILMLALLPFLRMRKWLAWGHLIFGGLVITAVTINYVVLPLPNFFGGRDAEAATVYNWSEVADFVRSAEEANSDVAFLATTRFQLGSQLSFAMGRADITAIEVRPSQFDIWEQRDQIAGKNALILNDEFGYLDEAKRRFDEITKVDSLTVERFGYPLLTYDLYLGTNYKPRATNLVEQ